MDKTVNHIEQNSSLEATTAGQNDGCDLCCTFSPVPKIIAVYCVSCIALFSFSSYEENLDLIVPFLA